MSRDNNVKVLCDVSLEPLFVFTIQFTLSNLHILAFTLVMIRDVDRNKLLFILPENKPTSKALTLTVHINSYCL